MNVLQLTLRYPPAPGGAESFCKQICDELKYKKYNVEILASDLYDHVNFKKIKDKDEINRLFSFNIPKQIYPVIPNMFFKPLFSDNYDIIHSWTLLYFPALAGVLLKQIKKKSAVLSAIVDENNLKYKQKYKRFLGKYLMNYDCVLGLTEYSLKILNENKLYPKRFEVISPFVDLSEFKKEEDVDIKIDKNKFNILFVGRIAYGKGLDILLKSLKQLKKSDIQLNIVGPDWGEKDKLIKIVDDYELNDNVTFFNNISREELLYMYKNNDVLVLPSRYEAFGIVLIEAYAAKLPVIAMNNSAIPYVVKNNETGLLFENENSEDLTDKIKYFYKNNASEFIDNAYKTVENIYEKNIVISKLIKIYNEIS